MTEAIRWLLEFSSAWKAPPGGRGETRAKPAPQSIPSPLVRCLVAWVARRQYSALRSGLLAAGPAPLLTLPKSDKKHPSLNLRGRQGHSRQPLASTRTASVSIFAPQTLATDEIRASSRTIAECGLARRCGRTSPTACPTLAASVATCQADGRQADPDTVPGLDPHAGDDEEPERPRRNDGGRDAPQRHDQGVERE